MNVLPSVLEILPQTIIVGCMKELVSFSIAISGHRLSVRPPILAPSYWVEAHTQHYLPELPRNFNEEARTVPRGGMHKIGKKFLVGKGPT